MGQSLKGELKDIDSRKNVLALMAMADKMYFEIIVNKTASLFAGAAKVGSQEANAASSIQDLFYEYGKNIGVAYQFADDMHDFKRNSEMLPVGGYESLADEKKIL
jgi:geranylgeranyl pyrophosphate synthase